jgi:3-methyl-2-oxobutanoate hydroxymethyltransferase
VQGKSLDAAKSLIRDALIVQEAGAFSVVLEAVPAAIATVISKKLDIPTIGIGAGAGCDGQVLVYQDMLSMFANLKPKFVKVFGDVGTAMKEAFEAYIAETKAGTFPGLEHTFASDISEEDLQDLLTT